MPAFTFLTNPQKEAVADLLLNQETLAPADRQADLSVGGIMLNEPYTHTGYNQWLDTKGYPAVRKNRMVYSCSFVSIRGFQTH